MSKLFVLHVAVFRVSVIQILALLMMVAGIMAS